MSTTLIVILVVVAGLIGLITVNHFRMKNAKPVETSKKIVTLNNKNFKLALRKKIILIDFWAPWCGPCKMVAPILNDIAETQNDITIGKINVDNNQAIANKYKIRSIPTLLIFKDGVEAGRIIGVKTKKAILREVNAVIAN